MTMTQPEKDDEPIYYQDTKEGKEWADWAYKDGTYTMNVPAGPVQWNITMR